jgi:hypothetical protein
MLTPHTPWGIAIYQEWMLGFNPKLPQALKILIWCTFKKFPPEYKIVEPKIG